MKKTLLVLSFAVLSLNAFADSKCAVNGGEILNLPSNSYFQNNIERQQNEVKVTILEKSGSRAAGVVLNETFLFERKDTNGQKSFYKSSDGKVILTILENQNGETIGSRMMGVGRGVDKRAKFVFETRVCGDNLF